MKPVIIHNSDSPVTISMRDMEILSFAIVVGDVGCYAGKLVWRISQEYILDMSSDLSLSNSWNQRSNLRVRPVEVKMTLEVLGE